MKHTSALFVIFAIIFCGPVMYAAEQIAAERYLQNKSVFSPVAANSIKDLIQQKQYRVPAAASKFDPFSYIPHGQLAVPPAPG